MNYLDEITLEVQARPIPWEGYIRSGLISTDNAAPFKGLEKSGPERTNILSTEADKYVSVVGSVLSSCSQDDVLKYVLLFASDSLKSPQFSSALAINQSIWTTLSSLLDRQDQQIRLLDAKLLVELASKTLAAPEIIAKLFDYLYGLISSDNAPQQDLALQWISILLQTKQYRQEFWNLQEKMLPAVDSLIKPPAKGGLQAQYYGLLSLWLLSFDKDLAIRMTTDYDTVDTVLQAAKAAVKEKITRVAVATLVNLVQFAPTAAASLIGHRGLPAINALADRKWSDEELREDIATLRDTLTTSFENMSTFDVYLSELNSKHLQWSPPHRSPAFWKANIAEFSAHDYRVLRKLIRLLLDTSSPLIQAVACNDISYIIVEDPNATSVLTEEKVKQHIMSLMQSSDPEVRYEALKATQAFISKLFKA